ncbi:NDP-glycosyltransferase YjiC-like [Oppia nitens]|uniref:NDP-glycosyltransferase YjiC-like n=1 Tax=Oppia nitens TaxID=1686743 RepID=UPI0023DA417E|nr:NDP-glycosyltransferase YjiC-like [Oppia nitens]
MSKNLTVLFAPINLVGPVNASIGIAQVLQHFGHRIVFAVRSEWKGKLAIHNFEEEIIGTNVNNDGEGSAKQNVEDFQSLFGNKSRLEKLKCVNKDIVSHLFQEVQENEPFLEDIVTRIKPDVIIADQISLIPSLMCSDIPWVLVMTCNPLSFQYAIDDHKLPPTALGLPTNGDPNEWNKLKKEINESISDEWNQYNQWITSKGIPSLQQYKLITPSPYLNIYIFPEELDYTDIRPLAENFHRFDYFKRSGNEEVFEIPEKLENKSGKLIYLSMGSMGSGDVQLMKRLISILAKSRHQFIVSMGQNGDQYELADNMWGQKYLPQIKVLATVDMVITHGGNNTLTETFYFGKPFLVMPLFFDQFDNAQRVEEKGFAIQMDPYNCTEQQLLDAIETTLTNESFNHKMMKASQRIQKDKNLMKLPKLLQSLVK